MNSVWKMLLASLSFCMGIFAQDFRKATWDITDYIWNLAIVASCDKGVISSPVKFLEQENQFDTTYYRNIKAGDIVWLRCRFVPQFYKQVLPTIQHPFILVINNGDESFPSDCKLETDIENFIEHPKIIHIFAQNCDYRGSSKKVSAIPIGLDYHTIAYKDPNGGWGEKGSPLAQEAALKQILRSLQPTYLRKKKAFVDFQLADTMHADHQRYLQFGEDRKTIFNRLVPTGLIDHAGWMRRTELWKTKGQYAFSISPHGNGLDCHRTWEDLILGCIVIVKTSPLDPLYEGLPVVIIKDWSEITAENLDRWIAQFGDAFTNLDYRQKLTTQYWLNKIHDMRSISL